MYERDRSGRQGGRTNGSGGSRGTTVRSMRDGSGRRQSQGRSNNSGRSRNGSRNSGQRSGAGRGGNGRNGQGRPTVVQGGRSQQRGGQQRGGQQRRQGRPGTQQGRRPNQGRGGSGVRPQPNRGMVLPIKVAAIFAGVTFILACIITHAIMKPGIVKAEKEAKDAQAQVQELQQEVDRLSEEARAAQANASSGVDSPWTKSGKFTTGDATLDKEVKEFCDKNSSKDQKPEEAALQAYTKLSTESEYVERDDAQNPAGPDWRIQYARQYFEHDDSGNCYEFACADMYILRYFGFDDAMAQKVIIEKESGDWGEHGLCFVTNTDGKKCLLDTSFGVDGWMVDQTKYNYQIQDVTKDTPTTSTMSTDTKTDGGNAGATTTTGTTDNAGTTNNGATANNGAATDNGGTTNNSGTATGTTNATDAGAATTTGNGGTANNSGGTTAGANAASAATNSAATATKGGASDTSASSGASANTVAGVTEGVGYVKAKNSQEAKSKR